MVMNQICIPVFEQLNTQLSIYDLYPLKLIGFEFGLYNYSLERINNKI